VQKTAKLLKALVREANTSNENKSRVFKMVGKDIGQTW
jgi:hypothetical protein